MATPAVLEIDGLWKMKQELMINYYSGTSLRYKKPREEKSPDALHAINFLKQPARSYAMT